MSSDVLLNFLRKFIRDYGIKAGREEELFDKLWKDYPEQVGKEFLTFCVMRDIDIFEKLLIKEEL